MMALFIIWFYPLMLEKMQHAKVQEATNNSKSTQSIAHSKYPDKIELNLCTT